MKTKGKDNSGFLKVPKSLFESPWGKEKRIFSKVEAYIDILYMARYSDSMQQLMINGKMITYGKDQWPAAYRLLRNRWKWSNEKITSFLNQLKLENMITTNSDQGVQIIMIMSGRPFPTYFQKSGRGSGRGSGRPNSIPVPSLFNEQDGQQDGDQDSGRTVTGNIQEEGSKKDCKKDSKTVGQISFDQFWDLYDKKRKKQKCEKKWNSLTEADQLSILKTLPFYKDATPEKQYRQDPLTYLNNSTWEDEIIKTTKNGTHNRTPEGGKHGGAYELLNDIKSDYGINP